LEAGLEGSIEEMIHLAKRGAQVRIEHHPWGHGGIKYRYLTSHPTRADKDLLGGWRVLEDPGEEIRKLVARNDNYSWAAIASKLRELDDPEDFTEFQDDPDDRRPRILYAYRNGNLWASTDPDLITDSGMGREPPGDTWRRIIDSKALAPPASSEAASRASIPTEVRREVWRRDEGRCVNCGSQNRLEFDHIIPVAMGGGNTARNIQLLCEECNRGKGATLG